MAWVVVFLFIKGCPFLHFPLHVRPLVFLVTIAHIEFRDWLSLGLRPRRMGAVHQYECSISATSRVTPASTIAISGYCGLTCFPGPTVTIRETAGIRPK